MELMNKGLIFDAQSALPAQRACSFTSLLRLSSGIILAGFRRGSSKRSADGNCCLAESRDGGQSWRIVCQGFETELNGIIGEIRSITLAESDCGDLLAFLIWVDRSCGEKYYSAQTDTVLPSKIVMTRSLDAGRTWSTYTVLDTGPWQHAVLSGPAVLISRNRWLVPYEKQEPETPGGPSLHSAHAVLVTDSGEVEKIIQVARDPQDRLFFYDQRQTFCSESNRLITAFWTYDRQAEKDACIHIARCDPGKLEWEQPFSTGLTGQIAQPILLPDGRLLLFYVRREMPCSMRLICSADLGETWSRSDELVVYSKTDSAKNGEEVGGDYAALWDNMMFKWTFGHPAGVLTGDRTILLAYYAGPDERCLSMHWARLRL